MIALRRKIILHLWLLLRSKSSNAWRQRTVSPWLSPCLTELHNEATGSCQVLMKQRGKWSSRLIWHAEISLLDLFGCSKTKTVSDSQTPQQLGKSPTWRTHNHNSYSAENYISVGNRRDTWFCLTLLFSFLSHWSSLYTLVFNFVPCWAGLCFEENGFFKIEAIKLLTQSQTYKNNSNLNL